MTRWLFVLSSLIAIGCGGDNKSPGREESPGGGGSGIPIRGGDRIVWDQPVDSPTTAGSYTFTLYVDGAKMPLTETRCANVRTAGGVECSGLLPTLPRGAHTLEITASVNGFESGRSQPLAVSINSIALSGAWPAIPTPLSEAGAAALATICLETASRECYQGRSLGSVAASVTALTAAGDLIFIVEGGSRVRVVVKDLLEQEPALTLDGAARITGLAVAPDFERSHLVFVAWSEPSRDGQETLNITRYRELLGILGEGATIVTGLPLSPGLNAPITIDDQGLIYVALPASSSPTAVAPATDLSNFILRFAADGSVPAGNPTASPVIAHGFARPSSMVWDAPSRELWLSGTDPRWSSRVSTLDVDLDRRAEWPWMPFATDAEQREAPSADAPLLGAVTTGAGRAGVHQIWVMQNNRVAQRVTRLPGQRMRRFDSLSVDQLGPVVAVSPGPGRDLLLATRAPNALESVVWRLTRQASIR